MLLDCILFIAPLYEVVAVEYLKIFDQTLVKRVCLFAKMLFHSLAYVKNTFFTVKERPHKASKFVKVYMRHLWPLK